MYFFFEENKKTVKQLLHFLPRTQGMPLVENDPFLKDVWFGSACTVEHDQCEDSSKGWLWPALWPHRGDFGLKRDPSERHSFCLMVCHSRSQRDWFSEDKGDFLSAPDRESGRPCAQWTALSWLPGWNRHRWPHPVREVWQRRMA